MILFIRIINWPIILLLSYTYSFLIPLEKCIVSVFHTDEINHVLEFLLLQHSIGN